MITSIPKPASDTLNSSIALVLSADQKTALSVEQITPGKRINEQEGYATLVHQALKVTNPKLATRFEGEIKQATEQYKKNHSSTNMFKVSDRLMRQYVRDKALSQEQYRDLRDHAFGRAQLDSNRTLLSSEHLPGAKDGDTPVRAVSTFHKKLETNLPATAEEISQFRAQEAEISVQQWRENRQDKSQKPPVLSRKAEATPGLDSGNLPPGFLWKPVSDADGHLVVLLPAGLSTISVVSLNINNPENDAVIETGRYAGVGNGGRLHFRFSKQGSSYHDGIVVEALLTDGSVLKFPIKETSARIGA